MKKLILALMASGTIVSAQAQKAGSILIYGNAGVMAEKATLNDGLPGTTDEVVRNLSWNFSPGIGYQFNDHWTVGVNFGIGSSRWTLEAGGNSSDSTVNEMVIGPFIRHTMPISQTFFIFNQLNLSYLSGGTILDDGIPGTPDMETKYNGFGANYFPAVGVNVTKCLALNFAFGGLGYNSRTFDHPGSAETTYSGFSFTFGQQFNFGISANIGVRGHKKGGRTEPGMDHRRLDTRDEDDE